MPSDDTPQRWTEADEAALFHPRNLVAVWLDQGAILVRQGGQWRDTGEQMMQCARMLEKGLTLNPMPGEWLPIASAPKDGTNVLLCWSDGVMAPRFDVGHNLGLGRVWQDTHHYLHNRESWPTHWMPLPLPPEGDDTPRIEREMSDSRSPFPQHCAVRERTGDGHSVGRCWCSLSPDDVCPRHGDVRAGMQQYRDTGRLFEDPRTDQALRSSPPRMIRDDRS